MIIRPPAVEPNSQLQLRLCRWAVQASVVREVQSEQYFALGLKVLSLKCFAAAAIYSVATGLGVSV
jgi:hypothetical protein